MVLNLRYFRKDKLDTGKVCAVYNVRKNTFRASRSIGDPSGINNQKY